MPATETGLSMFTVASAVSAEPKRVTAPAAAGAIGVQLSARLQSPPPAFAQETCVLVYASCASMVCAPVLTTKVQVTPKHSGASVRPEMSGGVPV